MRSAFIALIAGMLALPVFAADAENKMEATTDTSTNPLTGTQTTTKKYKRKVKNPNGVKSTQDVTEKTKVKTDGTVEKSVDSDAVNAPAHK